jgi:hypothetical protein
VGHDRGDSRRQRISQPKVRSTTHRRGGTENPDLLRWLVDDVHLQAQPSPGEADELAAYPPSANTVSTEAITNRTCSRARWAAVRSCTPAVVTDTSSNSPRVSTTMWRLRPLMRLPAS